MQLNSAGGVKIKVIVFMLRFLSGTTAARLSTTELQMEIALRSLCFVKEPCTLRILLWMMTREIHQLGYVG